ncbi:MAG TPA: 2OG-Fe(II) oxygenase [Bryobacteraceae bacterium]|nr:2OG-Fe(II) oxygenase [Bryobacteraceae bacterium]
MQASAGHFFSTSATPEISPEVAGQAERYRAQFLAGRPFKHVVIENFFEAAFAERLLAEFPRFDPSLARNEGGALGGKAVNTNLRAISPAYQQLYDAIGAKPFLDLVSRLSGIPDLILDPKMFGGGTHENLHGQELDPHVDFNYDEARRLHRRLNLIVYLNKDWAPEWGGALEIHSNPRRPEENQISRYDPLFNRCVMFETNERSWHGFPRIDLPPDKRHLSRKSISIYLYTETRPAEETAPLHATFYVQRPLPAHFREGHVLTGDDIAELRRLLIRRDGWIELYQNMELAKNREIAEISSYLSLLRSRVRAPLTGYVVQEGGAEGVYDAGDWAGSRVRVRIRPIQPVTGLLLRGFRPDWAPDASVGIAVNGILLAQSGIKGEFEIGAALGEAIRDVFEVEITSDSPAGWAASRGDDRDLAFLWTELRVVH